MRVKYLPQEAAVWALVREAREAPHIERDPGRIAAFFGRFGMGK